MRHTIIRRVTGCAAALTALLLALPATAATSKPVTWKVIGVINGQAWPFTTAAYFPRPLSTGELVEITFKVDSSVPGFITGTYGAYEGAVTSAKLSGSNWSIALRAPLGRGAISIANDDADYGDSLFVDANTAALAGRTWYSFDVFLRNPGVPSPGVGPWAPFTSLALPKSPPALGYFPGQGFYLAARRDQAGQPVDGGTYSGQILSITLVKDED
jgi:hypothetical protein